MVIPLPTSPQETRKIRKQRREEREKEKQDLIRQGLLEPPPPKVKISNLMRVLGEEATMDPTAIEQTVRVQMAERSQVDLSCIRWDPEAEACCDKWLPCDPPSPHWGSSGLSTPQMAELQFGHTSLKCQFPEQSGFETIGGLTPHPSVQTSPACLLSERPVTILHRPRKTAAWSCDAIPAP